MRTGGAPWRPALSETTGPGAEAPMEVGHRGFQFALGGCTGVCLTRRQRVACSEQKVDRRTQEAVKNSPVDYGVASCGR